MLTGIVNKNIRWMKDLGSCHPSFLPSLSPHTYLAFLFLFFLNSMLVEALEIVGNDEVFLGGFSFCYKGFFPETHSMLSIPPPHTAQIPSSLHFIPDTCFQNSMDHMLVWSPGPDLRPCTIPPPLSLTLSLFLALSFPLSSFILLI